MTYRTRIKVCGITREADVEICLRLSIDLIGIIRAPSSPRFVSMSQARTVGAVAQPLLPVVGVYTHLDLDKIRREADRLKLAWVQLHQLPSEAQVKRLQRDGLGVIAAVGPSDVEAARSRSTDLVLIDNIDGQRYGGTGQTFDWNQVREVVPNMVLAGGIRAQNVVDGLRRFRPLVVDVNSGVESEPGIKSARKLTRFVERVRGYDNGNAQ